MAKLANTTIGIHAMITFIKIYLTGVTSFELSSVSVTAIA